MVEVTSSGDSLEALEVFIGEWRLVAVFKDLPPTDADARVTFDWLPGKRFLIERWEIPVPEAPDGIAIIGADPEGEGNYLQHYFDSRGVVRLYKMSLEDGSGNCGETSRTSRRSISPSSSRAPSAMTARRSPAAGRSATTARPGSTTSTSPTARRDDAIGRATRRSSSIFQPELPDD
jgi:hypothetical protein